MANQIAKLINQLYLHTDGMKLSMDERDRLEIADSNFTYGEINPKTFGDILAEAAPKTGEVFYDLGSGAGKAVFCAAMLNDWRKCCGVELLPALCQTSQRLIPDFLSLMQQTFPAKKFHIDFIEKDVLDAEIDDADVIYLHATTFGPPMWDLLKDRLNQLRAGTRVIVNTKQLDSTYFEKISEKTHEMGWGESMVFTYIKK